MSDIKALVPMTQIKVWSCICQKPRCGYKWISRSQHPPEQCPNCHSRSWYSPVSLKTGFAPGSRRKINTP